MKIFYKISGSYAILALIGGVFYREFTKFNNYTQQTSLAFLHVHLFALGMLMHLLLMLFENQFSISQTKAFKKFILFYNIGLITTVIMMIVRGVMEVLNVAMSSGLDASISGVAGIGHILLAIGIFFLYRMFSQAIFKK
ncbi:MAG: DUF2871 domain-containing protein [Erysipelotrichaceae bacterium]|nr:DUF2871 domain-containing protein [Erysipelotrichaceae bacterium]